MQARIIALTMIILLLVTGTLFAQENTQIAAVNPNTAQPISNNAQPASGSGYIKQKINLSKAIELALAKSTEYENALLDIEIYRLKINESRSKRLPTINGAITGTAYANNYGISGYDTWIDKKFTIVGAGQIAINYPLDFFGSISHSIMYAEDSVKAKLITAEKIKKQVILNVKKSFFGIIIAREQVKVAKESYAVNRANYDIARRNFLQGLKPQIEVLQIQVSMEEARSALLNAEANVINTTEQLAYYIGDVAKDPQTELVGGLETAYLNLNFDDAYRQATVNNEDIQIYEISVSMAKHNRVVLAAYGKPAFSLFGNFAVTHAPENSFNMSTFSSQRTGSRADFSVYFGIRIDFPLSEIFYPRSHNATRSRVGQVDYDIRRTANIIQQAKDQLRLSLINLYNTKKNLETQINIYKNLVQVAKNNLRTAQIRYREGSLDYLSMRNIEIQFNGVSLQYNQFLFNYLINKTEILHLIGQISVENN